MNLRNAPHGRQSEREHPALAPDPFVYVACGWFIGPLQYGTKDRHLTPHGFKDATRNPDHIRAWIARHGPRLNWLLWPAPSGQIVIDWETAAGEATMREWGLWDLLTLRVITARGAHHYFTSPSGADIETATLGPGTTVRHRKGYTLLPPSRHPSGHVYRWEGEAADLRPLPDVVLERLRASDAARAAPVTAHAQDAPTPRVPLEPADAAVLEHRIAAYIARVGGRGEGSRNVTAFQVAAWLVRDMALTDDEAWPWLTAWNVDCRPPLAERELATVLRSAGRSGTRAIGSGRPRSVPG